MNSRRTDWLCVLAWLLVLAAVVGTVEVVIQAVEAIA